MGKFASKIIELAKSWLGKKESNGSHKMIIDIYNKHKPLPNGYKVKYTDSWCATFISALAIKLGFTDIIPIECSCQRMIELCKGKGIWIENENRTPKEGEIIFYDWDDNGVGDNKGWSDHVGLVEKVSSGVITVIEGNYGDSVKRRTIKVNAKNIRGYASPKYDAEPVKEEKTKSIDDWAKEVIAGKHGMGHANREASLKKAGCKFAYSIIRKRVNELAEPVKKEVSYYPKYTGTSKGIDTVFRAIGVPERFIGNWKNRRTIAIANGLPSNYTGGELHNLKMIDLAKKGKLKRP